MSQSRSIQEYKATFTATNGHWEDSSGATTVEIPVVYGTTLSKSGTTLTVDSSNYYYFIKDTDVIPYVYENERISDIPSSITGNLTIAGIADKNICHYTLTISVTGGEYGTYAVNRTSSPYAGASIGALSNGATIYYGDVLEGISTPGGTY